MNWGNKLIVAFVAFAALMSYMVYRCVQTPVNLVTAEYYKDELAYQEVIDSKANADALSSKVKIGQEKQSLHLQFPAEMSRAAIHGEITFYCAADAGKDRHWSLSLDPSGSQELDLKTVVPGHYTVKIRWEDRSKKYYVEEPFTIF